MSSDNTPSPDPDGEQPPPKGTNRTSVDLSLVRSTAHCALEIYKAAEPRLPRFCGARHLAQSIERDIVPTGEAPPPDAVYLSLMTLTLHELVGAGEIIVLRNYDALQSRLDETAARQLHASVLYVRCGCPQMIAFE